MFGEQVSTYLWSSSVYEMHSVMVSHGTPQILPDVTVNTIAARGKTEEVNEGSCLHLRRVFRHNTWHSRGATDAQTGRKTENGMYKIKRLAIYLKGREALGVLKLMVEMLVNGRTVAPFFRLIRQHAVVLPNVTVINPVIRCVLHAALHCFDIKEECL